MGAKSFKRQTLRNKSAVAGIVGSADLPVINAIVVCDSSYNELDDTALNPAGGYAKIVGNNFEAGSIVYFNGSTLITTYISSRELRIETPTITVGSYNLMLFNLSTGQGAIYLNLNVSNFPTITTSASSPLDTEYETKPISASISATGDGPITYSIVPGLGNLPDGVTLSSDGVLSGITSTVEATTTYTFVVQAKDAQKQDATRQFSLTVNVDVVDWVSPSAGATISAYEYTQFTPTTLNATSRAGYGVTYASNNLPTGVSVSGNTIVGQSNTVGTTNVAVVATSNTTNKSATRYFNVAVNPDVVTWSSPANNATISAYEYTAFSPTALTANSAAGFDVTYDVDTLPAGLSIVNNFIVGTSNVAGNTATTLTATANTTNRTADRSVNFVVNQDVVNISSPTPGSVFSAYEYTPFANVNLSATSAAGFDVAFDVDVLPTGLSLSGNTISGTVNVVGTTNTTVTATANTTNRTSTSNVQFVVNQDVVSWSSPADGTTYTSAPNIAISNVSLSATSAAGFNVSYSVDNLPNGVTLSGSTISGTPTVAGTTNTTLTATAATTGRTSTRLIYWSINLTGDAFWKNVSLLLSADANSQPRSFISDASNNNSRITANNALAAVARATDFNPYQHGYYGAQFNGTTDYITLPASDKWDFGSGPFTVEAWVCQNAITSTAQVIAFHGWSGSGAYNYGWNLQTTATAGAIAFYANGTLTTFTDLKITPGKWCHVAICGSGGILTAYLDGVKSATTYAYTSIVARSTMTMVLGGWNDSTESIAQRWWFGGYISNFRVTKTAQYSATFTPSTTPLTPIAGTMALLCQSNRFIDTSPARLPVTVVSTTKILSAHPFSAIYQSSDQGYGVMFDGTGDYMTTSASNNFDMGTGDFTIECFATTNGYAGSQYGRGLFALYPSGNYNKRLIVRHTNADNRLNVYGYDGAGIYFGTSGTSGSIALTNGLWYHIALVRQSGVFRLYINGQQDIVVSNQTAVNLATSNCFDIGRVQEGSTPDWNGAISNFRVIKGTCLYPDGTLFVPPTTSLTAVSGTTLLTCHSTTIVDSSATGATLTVGGTPTVVAGSPFVQSSGYTSNTFVSIGSGYFPSNAYCTVPVISGLGFGTGAFTWETWIYTESTGAYFTIYDNSKQGDTAATGRMLIDHNTGGNIRMYTAAGTTHLISSGNGGIAANQWNHISFTRSGTVGRLFINGVQVASNTTMSYSFLPVTASGTDRPIILANGYDNGANRGFGVYLADLRVVSNNSLYSTNFVPHTNSLTAVSNTQLLTMQTNWDHNNSGFSDRSGHNNILTRPTSTNITKGTFSPYGDNWSTYFGTTAMGVQTPAGTHSSITGYSYFRSGMDMTIEAWIYPISRHSGGGASFGYVVGDMNLSGGTLYWSFGPDSNGKLCLGWYTGAVVTCTSTNAIPLNTWTHIAVSISGGTIKLFINGYPETLVGTTSTSNVSGNGSLGYIASGGYMYGGSTWQGFNGHISNLRIVKAALYSSQFTPSTAPLTAVDKTGLLMHNSNRLIDSSSSSYALTYTGVPVIQKFSPFGNVTTSKYYGTYFNGTTDYITAPAAVSPYQAFDWSSNYWTVEGWYNFRSVGANGLFAYPDLLQAYYDGTNLVFDFRHATGPAWATNTTAYVLQPNTWYHIALVRNGSSMRAYVNGQAIGSASTGIGAGARGPVTGFGENLMVGASDAYPPGSPDRYMNGTISNFRISSVAVYTGNFTVPTSPLARTQSSSANIAALTGSQVTLLTCQDSRLIDNSTGGYTITPSTANVVPVSTGPFTPTVSDPTNYSPAVFGSSMYLDGNGDYLTAPNTRSFDLSIPKWTIECWFYQTSSKQVQLFSLGASSWRFDVGTNQGGSFVFGGSSVMTTPAGVFPLNQWNHIAVTNDGSGSTTGVKLFANGKRVATGQYYPPLDTTSVFYVGRNVDAGAGWDFNGFITDIRILKGTCLYNSSFALPVAPLAAVPGTSFLANGDAGGVIDASRTTNIEPVADARITDFSPYNGGGRSIYFDGTGDYLNVPTGSMLPLGTGDFTIEFWLYANSSGTAALVDCRNPDTANIGFDITYLTPNKIRFSTSGAAYIDSTTTISTGTWHHVALVRSSNTFRLYINGTQDPTTYSGSSTQNFTNTNYRIGSGANGPFNGYIADLRITRGVARTIATPTEPYSVK